MQNKKNSDKFWSFKDVGLPFLHDVCVLLSAIYSLHILKMDHWKMQKKDVFQLAAPLKIYQVDYEKCKSIIAGWKMDHEWCIYYSKWTISMFAGSWTLPNVS